MHRVNLNQMLGLPLHVECPRCKKDAASGFGDYELTDECNPFPGVWALPVTCLDCGYAWNYAVDLNSPLNAWSTKVGLTFFEKGLQFENNTPVLWCINLHRKVSKLWEAYTENRLKEPCDKPIELTCVEEEIADLLLRTLDVAWQLGIDVDAAAVAKHEYNKSRPRIHRRA